MASYEVNFTINVEGTNESVKSICEAIKSHKPKLSNLKLKVSQSTIELLGFYPITDEYDACEFAKIIARASNGVNFKAVGSTKGSSGGDMMNFEIELKNKKLTLRHSCWYYEHRDYALYGCETYEQYLKEVDDGYSEDEFNMVLTNKHVYEEDGGKFVLKPSWIGKINLKY